MSLALTVLGGSPAWPNPGQAASGYVVESDVKKHARLNMMSHLLSTIDYHDVEPPLVELPERPIVSHGYERPSRSLSTYVADHVATLTGDRE